ncbi:MAG: hypothetical protein LBS54_05020 [Dysgonamonadaceae bacterium]|nr:hypothetical protein [Dysgonamonadaceae bacterium]
MYQITEQGLKVSYEWDFDNDNVDISKYKFTYNPREYGNAMEKFLEEFTNKELDYIKYFYEANNQNSKFFHTQIQFAEKGYIVGQLFYNKDTEQYCLFKKT